MSGHEGHHGGHDMGMGSSAHMEPVEHRADSDGTLIIESHNGGHTADSLHASMMNMFFHFGLGDTILFEFWKPTQVGTLIASMIVIFLISFLYEALKFYREHLYRKSFRTIQFNTITIPVENGGTIKETQKAVQVKMLSWMHSWQTVLHMAQVILSYLLMLIFMTYNIWLCIAVILGAGSGYFFFGWKKSLVVDITEHCH